jgi:transposase
MRRTEWLQETRRMRFEEVYGGWQARKLTQEEAARVLGVSDRTFRRYVDRYEDEGFDGLRDKRLTQASSRKAPGAEVQDVVERYRTRHKGWNVKHFFVVSARRGDAKLHVGEDDVAGGGVGGKGQGEGGSSKEAGPKSLARDEVAPGRLDP